jgi:hypothetical protein
VLSLLESDVACGVDPKQADVVDHHATGRHPVVNAAAQGGRAIDQVVGLVLGRVLGHGLPVRAADSRPPIARTHRQHPVCPYICADYRRDSLTLEDLALLDGRPGPRSPSG